MILDLPRFLAVERPYWDELSALLDRIDKDRYVALNLEDVSRLNYLYQRSASALARLSTFSAEPQTREFLETLVARAYAECHPNRAAAVSFRPFHWFFKTFPRTFRRHSTAFVFTVILTVAGYLFGWGAIQFDPESKSVLMPFAALMQTPSERVKEEETGKTDRIGDAKSTFSAGLMTHNIKVALSAFGLGATWGVGTTLLLFYNGVMLGAVATDYINAGKTQFLLGWLLPHGVIEIPAILVAGQAGCVLAYALIGWGDSNSRRKRLRTVLPSMFTLAGGAAVMLVWAGIVEAFISQYHHPVLPYGYKIAFGLVELTALTLFLSLAGRRS